MTPSVETVQKTNVGWPKYASRLVFSLLLGGGFVALLWRGGLPIIPPTDSFVDVRPWAIVAFAACNIAMHVIKALRWRHLLRPLGEVPLRVLLAVSWVSFALLLLLPLRAGEVVRPVLMGRRSNVQAWEAAGTVAAERIVDGLMMCSMLVGALHLVKVNESSPQQIAGVNVQPSVVIAGAYGMFAVFVVAFAVMSLFYWRRAFARRLTHAVIGIVSTRLADTLAHVVERVASGLRFLPDKRHVAPFLFESVLFWALNVLAGWFCAIGVGLPGFTVAHAAVTLGCAGLGVLVPSGPGFFGVYQLSTYIGLALFFSEAVITRAGAAFVFALYVGQVGVHLIFALVGLLVDPQTNLRDAERIAREEPAYGTNERDGETPTVS